MTDVRVRRTICSEADRRQHQGRQYQVLNRGAGADRRSEPAELDAEDELGDEADDEDRHRDEDQAHDERARVEDAALAKAGDQADGDAADHLEERSARNARRSVTGKVWARISETGWPENDDAEVAAEDAAEEDAGTAR